MTRPLGIDTPRHRSASLRYFARKAGEVAKRPICQRPGCTRAAVRSMNANGDANSFHYCSMTCRENHRAQLAKVAR